MLKTRLSENSLRKRQRYKVKIRKSERTNEALKDLRKQLTTLLINQIARLKTLEYFFETLNAD